MKNFIFIFLLFCLLQNVSAQVTGKLTNAGGQPISFANVALLNSNDTSFIKAAITDERGAFKIENIGQGSYILRGSSAGFQNWNSPVFEIGAPQTVKDFGDIIMTEAPKQLDEVVVRSDKPLIKQNTEGIVVNIERSILTKASSVLQVLERSPVLLSIVAITALN